jgi:hypothetical protein
MVFAFWGWNNHHPGAFERRLSDFNKFEPFDIVGDGAIRCRGAVFALKQ